MALTADQTAYFQRKLGSNTDLTDAEARLVRLAGDQAAVVVEVLEQRLATLIDTPATFSADGYSQSTGANITALQARLKDAKSDADAGADVGDGISVARVVKAYPENRVVAGWSPYGG